MATITPFTLRCRSHEVNSVATSRNGTGAWGGVVWGVAGSCGGHGIILSGKVALLAQVICLLANRFTSLRYSDVVDDDGAETTLQIGVNSASHFGK